MNLKLNNRFTNELAADPIKESYIRKVSGAYYSYVNPTPVSAPSLVAYSKEVSELLDLDETQAQSPKFLEAFSGNKILTGMKPYAMCYGGHQFGNWAGQLGDGRAINLGEVQNKAGETWAVQLKGSGLTPYSRTADGLAVLRSSIREFLCSEAMYHLGVPTTRALSLMTSGEEVMRDMLYDGRPRPEKGAIVCRVAPSFLRFGSYQLFAANNELVELRALANYTIKHHFTHLLERHKPDSAELYSAWFSEVCESTLKMVINWMRVGFVHGVMNTDNMSILGLTMDYGPYGWLENYDPNWTPNTTDSEKRRYRYGQQGNVALWNLFQLANAIYPLIEQAETLEQVLKKFNDDYQTQSREMLASKLGLQTVSEDDQPLLDRLLSLMAEEETDMTIFYRLLASESEPNYFSVSHAFYELHKHSSDYRQRFEKWFAEYNLRLKQNAWSYNQRKKAMNAVNPKYVFRNYIAQLAIDKANEGDNTMVNELLELFRNPYKEQPEMQHYAEKRPDWARTKAGCSMLSCSS